MKNRLWPNMHQCIQNLPQIVLCSKFKDSIPFGYIQTGLNATGEPFDRAHEDFHEKDNVHKHAELMQKHNKTCHRDRIARVTAPII